MSRGDLLSGTRRKPAHCSKALGPSLGTFKICFRVVKGPLSSRYLTMFFAVVPFSPATRVSRGAEAVFTSTPTAFTQSSTTPSRASPSLAWGISCWYWPTPMDLGSIFTSSARGSCKRRAMDTAERRFTSNSGNSSAASLEAEYTDAPASFTMA